MSSAFGLRLAPNEGRNTAANDAAAAKEFQAIAFDVDFHYAAELEDADLDRFLRIVEHTATYRVVPVVPGGGLCDLSAEGRQLHRTNPNSPDIDKHIILGIARLFATPANIGHELGHLSRHCGNITPLPADQYGENRIAQEERAAWWIAFQYAPRSCFWMVAFGLGQALEFGGMAYYGLSLLLGGE